MGYGPCIAAPRVWSEDSGVDRNPPLATHAQTQKNPPKRVFFTLQPETKNSELVHGVVFTCRLQRCFAAEVILVIVADVRAGHVLMFHAGDALADFLALHAYERNPA